MEALFLPDCGNREAFLRRFSPADRRYIGRSICRRPIEALRIGCGEPRVLIAAGFHGTEYLTVLAALEFALEYAEAPRNEVWFIPCVNPDGTEIALHGCESAGKRRECVQQICADRNKWQANARGVDINHNFDADWEQVHRRERAMGIDRPSCTRYGGAFPESEPETQALSRLCRRVRFERVLALHSQGREIYWDFGGHTPPCCRTLADKMAAVSGYRVAKPEPIATGGGFKDWFIQCFHRCGYTVEMGLGENPLPLSELPEEYPRVRELLRVFINN